jgi:hypothetical protein
VADVSTNVLLSDEGEVPHLTVPMAEVALRHAMMALL